VYALDTIGAMGKSAPSRLAKSGPAYGQWAAEALEGLGLARANMIGASNGGWLILKLGSVAPDMIGSAVLMSSAGFMSISMRTVLRMIPRSLFKSPEGIARGLLELLSPPDSPPDPFFLAFFELIVVSGFRSEQMAPALSEEEIEKLTAPTYLLMGQYEVSFNPYKAIERGLALLPNVIAAEIVPGVGHAMVHRQPDWVIARVMSFLERHAPEGHRPKFDGQGSPSADRSSP
jgi:pimeloyl-ACP methyl ester carboxylesterase